MGARPSTFKRGGGFLNGVDGVITSYRFTDQSPSKDGPVDFKPGKHKGPDGKLKDNFHSLYFELHARADGAKEEVQTSLFAGGYDDYEVSEDGLTLTSPDGGPVSIGASTAAGIFITSIVEAGFDENEFDEDETTANFEPIVGKRYRFVQRRNDEATKKLGKRVDKKTGKAYDRNDLVVDQYYGPVEETVTPTARPTTAASKPSASKAAPTSSAKTETKSKPNGKAGTPTPAFDVAERSSQVLTDILAESGGSITKARLSSRIIQRLMKDVPVRDAVREFLGSDENLSAMEGISYDLPSRTISLATE